MNGGPWARLPDPRGLLAPRLSPGEEPKDRGPRPPRAWPSGGRRLKATPATQGGTASQRSQKATSGHVVAPGGDGPPVAPLRLEEWPRPREAGTLSAAFPSDIDLLEERRLPMTRSQTA